MLMTFCSLRAVCILVISTVISNFLISTVASSVNLNSNECFFPVGYSPEQCLFFGDLNYYTFNYVIQAHLVRV